MNKTQITPCSLKLRWLITIRNKRRKRSPNDSGISRIKVGRLLKKARQEGIVEISVKYHPVFSSQIEQQFISHFGIKRALIALDHHDEDEQRQQVAALGQ